jgi:FkbM family methyltransferase
VAAEPQNFRVLRQRLEPFIGPLRPIFRRLRKPDFDEIELLHHLLSFSGGVMVDVGAHFGSSLRPFANDGWRIYAIEPDSRNRAILTRRFGRLPNVRIEERAVSELDGARASLYTSSVSSGISTLAPFHPSHAPTEEVETVRLDTLLSDESEVTLLKTDTEGWDLPVLRTFPWDRLRPRAVMCEFEDRKTLPLGYDYDALATFLLDRGYAVFTSEWHPVVEYGRRHRWRSIRRYTAALEDPQGWGNVLAVEPPLASALQDVVSRISRT